MGDFKYAKNAELHYMYRRANAELRYECITRSFLIDESRITEFFSGYIVNLVTNVNRYDAGRRRVVRSPSL
ncbi:hypothetical protein TNCV_5050441 [Trichonephila clavipes]|nr:hypothetical protein TNCV_5050441 [Trichonephila clavipes]